MRVERIHRWQWVLIALVVGFVLAFVRNQFADPTSSYPDSMNAQAQFENGLATKEHLPNGEIRPRFFNLVVFTVKDPEAKLRSPDEIRQ
jgi:hypothetical protein